MCRLWLRNRCVIVQISLGTFPSGERLTPTGGCIGFWHFLVQVDPMRLNIPAYVIDGVIHCYVKVQVTRYINTSDKELPIVSNIKFLQHLVQEGEAYLLQSSIATSQQSHPVICLRRKWSRTRSYYSDKSLMVM